MVRENQSNKVDLFFRSTAYRILKLIGAIMVGAAAVFAAFWPAYKDWLEPENSLSTEHLAILDRIGPSDISVIVYWHRDGFDERQAQSLANIFNAAGAKTKVNQHRDPRAPDSIFIGHAVGADLARIALLNTPYGIQYLFRPDYPAIDGSESKDGKTIGIGYRSTHMEGVRTPKSEPLRVNESIIEFLTAPGISDLEFQSRLKSITGAQ